MYLLLFALLAATRASGFPNTCIVSKVDKWESWDDFNPLLDVEDNQTTFYKAIRCVNGISPTLLSKDVQVLYMSRIDFTDSRTSLAEILRNLPNLVAVAIDFSDLRRQMTDGLFSQNLKLQYISITQCSTSANFLAENIVQENLQLQVLLLASSGIEELPAGLLLNNFNLQKVDFSQNRLTFIPSGIFRVNSNLMYISLHGNYLTKIPSTLFAGLQILQGLDLSGNAIEIIPNNLLLDNTQLTKVDFGANAIVSLPESLFLTSGMLREAVFSNNKISLIPLRFFKRSSQLYVIRFGYNAISTYGLPTDLLSYSSQIFFLDLRGNAGMIPRLAAKHHGISDAIKRMIELFGHRDSGAN